MLISCACGGVGEALVALLLTGSFSGLLLFFRQSWAKLRGSQ